MWMTKQSFWKGLKPMVSDDVKCMQAIVLKQGSSIINEQSVVCQEFNVFFNQVTDSI